METFDVQGGQRMPPQLQGHDAVRCLGSGAQGQVWLMKPHNGTDAVAAKFMGRLGGGGPEDMNAPGVRHNESQLTREWRVLSQFRHDHLIAVHGLVQDAQGGQVIIMDHAAGGSLGQIIRARGVLTVGETVTVLTPIGQVLAFLHGRGAVHGDVAPGNILLSAAGKPLLADFGMGRLLGQRVGGAAGTPGFNCSFDVARDEAADVYALAAVGWYALTGSTAQATRDRPPLGSIVRDVPSELVAALEAGLNDDPAQRPTAAAFAQAVFRSAPAEPVALGNAVHPSVLPELQTRHERAERSRHRGRSAGGRSVQPPRRGHKPLRWHGPLRVHEPRGPAVAGLRRIKNGLTHRGPESLAKLWGGGEPKVKPSLRRAGAVVLAVTVLLGVMAVFGVVIMGGVLTGGENQAAEPQHQGGEGMLANRAEDLAWAEALPAEIQRGVVAAEPVSALHALAWLRSFALSSADQALLERVSVAGSPALAADTAIVQELSFRSHTLTGFETNIREAQTGDSTPSAEATGGATETPGQAVPADGDTVTVWAIVETSRFAEQDSEGAVVHRAVENQSQELGFMLVRVGERWRIQQVLAVENR